MKTILLTGGAGYIGSHTLVELQMAGYNVVSVDNHANSFASVYLQVEKITGKKIQHVKLDLCDRPDLKSLLDQFPDIHGIIHFAAYKAVGESVENPLKYYHNNLASLVNLLAECQDRKISNFIFSSSCSVYGNVSQLPVAEDTPVAKAESPYGFTKQIGEQMLQDFAIANPWFRSIALRYFNPVGAHPSALIGEAPINKPSNLVPLITLCSAGKIPSLTVFGNDYPTRDGTNIRDYIHVSDIADAHVKALDFLISNKQSIPYDVYNLGTGTGSTVLEVIHAFESVTGRKLNYSIGGRRPGDVVAVYADNKKAMKNLNWICKYNLENMMETAWKWQCYADLHPELFSN